MPKMIKAIFFGRELVKQDNDAIVKAFQKRLKTVRRTRRR